VFKSLFETRLVIRNRRLIKNTFPKKGFSISTIRLPELYLVIYLYIRFLSYLQKNLRISAKSAGSKNM